VSLRVVTSSNDTDFVVRLSDVYPGGATSMLLSDNVVRMRWRDSAVTRSVTQPGTEYVVTLAMWELCYVFNAGHSLRVAVTSSNYPRYSLNLNNDQLVWQGGAAVNATNTIVLGSDSYVTLPTVALAELPPKPIF
jgi:putative CocE/NonD family hydrolase